MDAISLNSSPMINKMECLASLELVAVLNPLYNKIIDQIIARKEIIEDRINNKISLGSICKSDFGLINATILLETSYILLSILKRGNK